MTMTSERPTLADILSRQARDIDSAEAAIQAAYWAGQEQARGQIARELRDRARRVELGRYWRAVECAVRSMETAAGAVRDDSREILAWDFATPDRGHQA